MSLAKGVFRDLRLSLTLTAFFAAASPYAIPHAIAEESHPGLASEALYSEGLIAYSRKQWDQALKLVNQALQGSPDHVEALELKALIHKAKNQDQEAIEAYEKLLSLKPESERGPYEFELAALYRRKKREDLARPLLKKAIDHKFNTGASHFFLGLMDFDAEDFEAAESHFAIAASDREPELQMAGLFYLGLIDFRQGNGVSGMERLSQSRELSSTIKESAQSAGLAKAAERMLAPFDRGRFFANTTVLPLFDSNYALLPLTGLAPSGSSTLKARASMGGGYITSPLKALQMVYSLKAFTNINGQQSALPYQFLNVSPSVTFNVQPLSRTSWGATLQIEQSWNYGYDNFGVLGYSLDRNFASLFSFAPYLKIQPTPQLKVVADVAFRKQDYHLPSCSPQTYPGINCNFYNAGPPPAGFPPPPRFFPTISDFNGAMLSTHIRANIDNGPHLLNPSAWMGADWNSTGFIPSYGALSAGIGNLARIDAKNALLLTVEAAGTVFYNIQRSDGTLGIHLNHVFQVLPNWSLIADTTYTWNASSWYEYSFSRFTGGIGVAWTL